MSDLKITITDAAAKQIAELAKDETEGTFLRISVTAGGCAGFEYHFKFDTQKADDDINFSHNGADVVVDETALEILDGSELDYVSEMIGASFVMRNPNASSSCGCGSSFSV